MTIALTYSSLTLLSTMVSDQTKYTYFHHLLMLYYPWRNESKLMAAYQSYTSKFYKPNVQEVIESNRSVFEPDADTVTEALENLTNNKAGNIIYSFDPINDQENSYLQMETQKLIQKTHSHKSHLMNNHLQS